jgi:hypothetical protein
MALVFVMGMVPPAARYVVLAAAVQLAGACDGSVEPIQVQDGCPGKPLRGPTIYENEPANQLIDDFEGGNGQIAQVEGRDGHWVLGANGTTNVIVENSPRCAARDRRAGHFQATNLSPTGPNWTAIFISSGNTAAPYDARKYSGISFWAAFGGENGPSFRVPLGVTTMDNAWNGGICTKCMDYYGTKVPLTGDWQRYTISFSALAQSGWGIPILPMRQDQLVGFIIWPLQPFDIWIDDVRFEP